MVPKTRNTNSQLLIFTSVSTRRLDSNHFIHKNIVFGMKGSSTAETVKLGITVYMVQRL